MTQSLPRIFSAVVVLGLALASRTVAQEPGSEAPPDEPKEWTLSVDAADWGAEALTWSGASNFPDGTKITVRLTFAGYPVATAIERVFVKKGAYQGSFRIPKEEERIAGTYTVAAEVRAEDQVPELKKDFETLVEPKIASRDAAHGTSEEAEQRRIADRDAMTAMLRECRSLYTMVTEPGETYLAQAAGLAGGDRSMKVCLLGSWESLFKESGWDARVAAAQEAAAARVKGRFCSNFPRAEDAFQNLLPGLVKLRGAYLWQMLKTFEKTTAENRPPAFVRIVGDFHPDALRDGTVGESVKAIASELELGDDFWKTPSELDEKAIGEYLKGSR